jgi:hypothetical protein
MKTFFLEAIINAPTSHQYIHEYNITDALVIARGFGRELRDAWVDRRTYYDGWCCGQNMPPEEIENFLKPVRSKQKGDNENACNTLQQLGLLRKFHQWAKRWL